MWQVSVTGHCDHHGKPRGAYVLVEDGELFDWLDTHGWLDDDAYDSINSTYNARDIIEMALADGTEAIVGFIDVTKRFVYKEMTESGIIMHCQFGAIGRLVDESEVEE